MLGLLNITPAAAEAPEHVRYTPSPVWYGPFWAAPDGDGAPPNAQPLAHDEQARMSRHRSHG